MQKNQFFEQLTYPYIPFRKNHSLNWLLPVCNLSTSDINALPFDFDKPSVGAFDTLIKLGFKGIYIGCPNLDEAYNNCLILVFNPEKKILWSEKWQIFVTFLQKLPNYRNIIDIDLGVIVLVINMDIKGQEVVRNFKKGTYSKISEKVAREYYIGMKKGGSYEKDEFLIVKKSEIYRKYLEDYLNCSINPNAEFASKPKMEEEIFTYKSRIWI